MATCRFFLVLAAASAGEEGVTGGTALGIWSALALGAYIAGVSYLARTESTRGSLRYWPCLLLVAPIGLALVVNQGRFLRPALLLSAGLLLWLVASLRYAFWSPQPNIGRTVSGLLAGIVLVDLLAVGGLAPGINLIFLFLFLLALLFQRFIPAT